MRHHISRRSLQKHSWSSAAAAQSEQTVLKSNAASPSCLLVGEQQRIKRADIDYKSPAAGVQRVTDRRTDGQMDRWTAFGETPQNPSDIKCGYNKEIKSHDCSSPFSFYVNISSAENIFKATDKDG